jgi:hypothetical protein
MVMVSLPAPNWVAAGMMPVATDWLRARSVTEITEDPGRALASVTVAVTAVLVEALVRRHVSASASEVAAS